MNDRIELLASRLMAHGLRHAFGVTGSGSSLLLITELERLGAKYYGVAHEAAAALMAGAVVRATQGLSVAISIKGPGVVNMLPGIVSNHFEGIPALSASEAFSVDTPSFHKHKRLDHERLLSPFTKGYATLDGVEPGLEALLEFARGEPPGPVHLDLAVTRSGRPARSLAPEQTRSLADPSQSDALLRHLARSERPIIVVGSLGTRRDWRHGLDTLSIPIFTTAAAKGALDERRPHSAGVFTGTGRELAPESQILSDADLIVGIGLRNTEVIVPKPFGSPLLIIDELNGGLAQGFKPDIALADPDGTTVSRVLDELRGKTWGLEQLARARRAMEHELLSAGWLPPACFQAIDSLAFPYALVLDTGSFCTIGEHLWRAGPERLFMGSNNARYMGVAIPTAIGMALGRPGHPVFCVVGDGGIGAHVAEIKLAIEERLPICFVLMADGRYGSVASVQQPKPVSLRAITIARPSWWRTVDAMGSESCIVEREASFVAALQSWSREGPLFIEAIFDPHRYGEMTRRLR